MRCYSCNVNLSDFESRLRSQVSGEFLDMCKKCLVLSGINYVAPADVEETSEPDDEFFVEEDDDQT